MNIDKTPYSKAHEEALLSCMMQYPMDCGEAALSMFGEANPMYIPANKIIYDAFIAIDPPKITPITICDYLNNTNQLGSVGGMEGIRAMNNIVPHTADFKTYLQWVKRLYEQRLILFKYDTAMNALKDPKAKLYEVVDRTEKDVNGILTGFGGSSILTMAQAAESAYDSLYDTTERLKFGLPSLDNILEGIPLGSMCTLAARPGCGKSTLLIQMILGQALLGKPVYMASLEMPYTQVLLRMVANLAQMNTLQILDPINSKKTKAGYDMLAELPIFIDDKPSLTISQFCRTCKSMRLEHGVQFVGLDYLQRCDLEQRRSEKREQTVARAATLLKNTMLENNQVGMVLAQLNRSASEGVPAVHHLRESGSIEQESDEVLLLHSERLTEHELNDVKNGKPQDIKCIVGKNRHGSCGVADMQWTKPYFMFTGNVQGDYYVPK